MRMYEIALADIRIIHALRLEKRVQARRAPEERARIAAHKVALRLQPVPSPAADRLLLGLFYPEMARAAGELALERPVRGVRNPIPASSYTRRISRSCDAALGAVIPLVVPSWLIPLATITPRTLSPSAIASRRGRSTTAATASPGTIPSAASPNAAHRPEGESMAARFA